jgi:type III secretion protein V
MAKAAGGTPSGAAGGASVRVGAGALVRALPGLLPTALVVALLACVLVPLPTVLVDLLLSLSLSAAVLVLVAALLVRRTTDFLVFPSLVLLLTLYRLALNVSTTRLVLSQADAGRVIDAFASVVVRDDLLVGGVMFAIITAVQFVVIARGAERVAEVGARFALDGLPGHQAAIDADLRAKVISPREAAARRARLGERSQFHGAMDGAMRFVKGDAIVGLVITAINLVGGIAVARWRHDMGTVDALETYGRLTIGDGLLSQIPALLVSLAAGVLVARVDRQDASGSRFGDWIDPPMLLVPAAFLLVLAIVPGMPWLAFAATAIALVTGAIVWTARREAERPPVRRDAGDRILVRVNRDTGELERVLDEVVHRCSSTLRIPLPPLDVEIDRALEPGMLEIWIGDRRIGRELLPSGDAATDQAVLSTFRAVMDHAAAFVSHAWIEHEIDDVRATQPALVDRALGRLDVVDVLALVRRLVHERTPCPRMADVLEVVAQCSTQDAADRARLPELVREWLAPVWLPQLFDALVRVGTPRVLRLSADAEDELVDRRIVGVLGERLTLAAEERAGWVAAITEAAAGMGGRGPILVLASPAARTSVAELTRRVTPHVTVLSVAELDAAGVPRPVPRIVSAPGESDRLAPG